MFQTRDLVLLLSLIFLAVLYDRNPLGCRVIGCLLHTTSMPWRIQAHLLNHLPRFSNSLPRRRRCQSISCHDLLDLISNDLTNLLQALDSRLRKEGAVPKRKPHKLTQFRECAGLKEKECYLKVTLSLPLSLCLSLSTARLKHKNS